MFNRCYFSFWMAGRFALLFLTSQPLWPTLIFYSLLILSILGFVIDTFFLYSSATWSIQHNWASVVLFVHLDTTLSLVVNLSVCIGWKHKTHLAFRDASPWKIAHSSLLIIFFLKVKQCLVSSALHPETLCHSILIRFTISKYTVCSRYTNHLFFFPFLTC